MNKIAIIVDSACTLPDRLLEKYNVIRVPLTITINGKSSLDPCSTASALQLFASGQLSLSYKVETQPPSPAAFASAIKTAIDAGAEQVYVQTVNRKQGSTYDNANTAATKVASELSATKKITVRVMDSRTVFSGQALMVCETLRQLLGNEDPNTVRRHMDGLSSKIQTYIIPKSPMLAWGRAKNRNERSVSRLQVTIANLLGIHPIMCNANDTSRCVVKVRGFDKAVTQLFRHVQRHIQSNKLLSPIAVINYAGPLANLKKLSALTELEAAARSSKIQLVVSEMSLAGAIYTSPGSISVSMIAESPEWQGAD